MAEKGEYVKWFSELTNKDVKIAGGKGASLAEMYNNKFPIPPGFVVTAQAYKFFIEEAGLKKKIIELFSNLDMEDTELLENNAKEMREAIVKAEMPRELKEDIEDAYGILDVDKQSIAQAKGGALDILRTGHESPFVAVRSSATAEDLADASFAGQQESFLNVKGDKSLLEKVKECFASLFTARAVYYRTKKGFSHEETHLAVVVQKMIDSEKSGVMFSKNPISKDNSVLIEAVWGLGEGIVSGRIKPDQYAISSGEEFKILEIKLAEKKVAITRDSSGANTIVKLTSERSKQQVLSKYELKTLSQYAIRLEEHYGKPQDIEFAIEADNIYIVQSRPITTKVQDGDVSAIEGEALLSGLPASPGTASGTVKVIKDLSELSKVKKGDILVTIMTNPDMVVTMQKASAIITDEGGVTSHAAIVSREMGIPAVVGTGNATTKLKDGQVITVDGNFGKVFEGRKETKAMEVLPIEHVTRTKIKVIVDLPDYAERAAKSRAKAIGLTRIEGIIASSGKHPLGFVKQKKIKDYVEILFQGLKKISQPFEEMWIRTSDIRSDEYRNLEGAPKEVEGNPMLGNHGIRFAIKNPEILNAELTAVKELADEYPDKVFGIMMPGVISTKEVEITKSAMEEIGMPSNIKLGVMVETPAAVQIINKLCETGIKFISFGTNDLTQYTLAVDRNNAEVQDIYEETNQAVLNSIRYVIRRCKTYNVETSICGQAGSRPEMVKFLVGEKIDSISVNADAAPKVAKLINELESAPQTVIEMEQKPLTQEVAYTKIHTHHKKTQEQPIPALAMASISEKLNKDMEDVILEELSKDEYQPSSQENPNEDVPSLNDAIPIEEKSFDSVKADDDFPEPTPAPEPNPVPEPDEPEEPAPEPVQEEPPTDKPEDFEEPGQPDTPENEPDESPPEDASLSDDKEWNAEIDHILEDAEGTTLF